MGDDTVLDVVYRSRWKDHVDRLGKDRQPKWNGIELERYRGNA
jgi:hypothetical protein